MVSMIDMVKILCGVGGFILIIFLIIMVSNAISTLKRLNAVLDDSKIVSEAVSRRVTEVDNAIDSVGKNISDLHTLIKGNDSLYLFLPLSRKLVQLVQYACDQKGHNGVLLFT